MIFLIGCVLLSQEAALQVLSAMQGLTSVFGMGTGVSPTLLQPYSLMDVPSKLHANLSFASFFFQVNFGQVLDLLVLISYIHYCTYTLSLSTT